MTDSRFGRKPQENTSRNALQPLFMRVRHISPLKKWVNSRRIRVSLFGDEANATEECDMMPPPDDVLNVFRSLGFPAPKPISLITLEHQIAQKLHGASGLSEHNQRAHDLIDLQVIMQNGDIDLRKVRSICRHLFLSEKCNRGLH